jgi:hypothetical protein
VALAAIKQKQCLFFGHGSCVNLVFATQLRRPDS